MNAAIVDCNDQSLSNQSDARILGTVRDVAGLRVTALHEGGLLWLAINMEGVDILKIRLGPGLGDVQRAEYVVAPDATVVFEYTTSAGAMRTKLCFPESANAMLHWTVSLIPSVDACIARWPRDLSLVASHSGTIHTSQRGLRTGIVFASTRDPAPLSLFYLQNFSSLNGYFAATKRTPADTVGGRWPHLGYAPPSGEDCVLPHSQEIVVSDAYLTLTDEVPDTAEAAAAQYLDMFAELYLTMPREATSYHDWPARAAAALRDLSLSPQCSYDRGGARYLMPYVGDSAKPPESMVQLTLAANCVEYDRWSNEPSLLGAMLRRTVPSFFDERIGSIVRWLPGEPFADAQPEENMNHRAMDSWYLHHALFNVARLAAQGDEPAATMLRKSLPYVMRVARRFAYRWPVFFDLESLDVIRAEAAPGRGGETDVAGLYALLMIHAHELFGDDEYLIEAEAAAATLAGLGFALAYQLNTTGFAAEATMRLWKLTGKRSYLATSEMCLANLFDNMWLWTCGYGHGSDYRTYFGLFPLRDAPYIAPYEELETHAKFHDFLTIGGDDVRPSLRLLIAEFQRHCLDRAWSYYPDNLAPSNIAPKAKNGFVVRGLTVPLEDLRDGFATSGQVGQEIYGAGLPLVLTARHYMKLGAEKLIAYSDYPMYDFAWEAGSAISWRVGGDPRGKGEIRVIPVHPNAPALAIWATAKAGGVSVPLRGEMTPEGHAAFPVHGDQSVRIAWAQSADNGAYGVRIGALA